MFTLFAPPSPPRATPVGGTLVSLTAHAAVVLLTLGGAPAGPAAEADVPAAGPAAHGGERLQWVGTGTASGPVGPRPGARPPTAYVIPGRDAAGVGRPGPGGAPRGAPSDTPLPLAARERRTPSRAPRIELPIPAPPQIDVTLLMPGVVASAPDLHRVAARPEDFARASTAMLLLGGPADGDVQTSDGLRAVGPVDVLPVALVSNPRPTYPTGMAQARLEGRVVVEFRIDSVGIVAPGSVRVVESTDARFTVAVSAVVPQLRFMPAQLRRQAVGLTVRQPFVFTMRPLR